jgi:hypothetical protein
MLKLLPVETYFLWGPTKKVRERKNSIEICIKNAVNTKTHTLFGTPLTGWLSRFKVGPEVVEKNLS